MKHRSPKKRILRISILSCVCALALAGCGDDGTEQPVVEQAVTAATGATGGAAATGKVISKKQLKDCLADEDLEIITSGVVPKSGMARNGVPTKQGKYLGFVFWTPSTNIADVHLAKSKKRAAATVTEIDEFFNTVGNPSTERILSRGNVVIVIDQEATPTPEQYEQILNCAS